MTDLNRHGKLSYVQIPADDIDRAADFYEAVFGWRVRRDADRHHRAFEDASGELIGAWVTGRAAAEPGVLPYISVDDIDAAAVHRITERGGAIVRPPYAEGDLRVATFRDSAGNVIGIWQAPR
jgi:predicted enzyme related to lactoylglutathione lyase